ncbi:MAG: glycine cleavage system protein GcvH [Tepidisphaeraceae bacterium]
MADAPKDFRYLQTHEWHRREGDGTVTLGITQFAADELTDITYVALPKVGQKIDANGRFGEIESVKATSDLYSGVAGEVVAINDQLQSTPGLVNTDPYGKGWMLRLRPTDPKQLDELLSAEDYLRKTGH